MVAEDLHRTASEQMEKHGLLINSPHSGLPMQSPFLPIVNRQATIMLKAAELLGCSPAARTRVQILPERRPEDNAFAEF